MESNKNGRRISKAVKRTIAIFHAEEGSLEDDELSILILLVQDYEDRHVHLPSIDPLEVIKLKMEERGLKAKDLEPIIGSKGMFHLFFPADVR